MFLVGLSLAALCFWWGIKITDKKDVAAVITGLFGMLLGFLYRPLNDRLIARLYVYEDKYLEDIRKSKLGIDGERMVQDELKKILDSNYYVRSNFQIPKQKFDIDEVIVGPKGLIILEVKNYEHDFIFNGNELYVKSGKKLIKYPEYWDPRNEVIRHTDALSQYLGENGFKNISIHKAVVLVREKSASFENDPRVYIIIGLSKLKHYFDGLPTDSKFDPEDITKLNEILTK